ncbi:MAG: hypothetical protein HN337_04410 [Deltaproteobacteria bacterium]|jgi:hypothetical protein|nr:hypothetical protein [Deltaproteobacteria bacterium]
MFSGGQTDTNPYAASKSPGSFNIPGMTQIPGLAMGNPFGNVSMKLTKEGEKKNFMNWQGGLQAGKMGVNTMIAGFNYGLQGKQIAAQQAIGKAYYNAQETISGHKMKVGMRQLDVQENGMYIQQEMHRAQVSHEERMMKLEGSTQARIAQIKESGKTARAKQIAVTDAFSASRSRDNYFYG